MIRFIKPGYNASIANKTHFRNNSEPSPEHYKYFVFDKSDFEVLLQAASPRYRGRIL